MNLLVFDRISPHMANNSIRQEVHQMALLINRLLNHLKQVTLTNTEAEVKKHYVLLRTIIFERHYKNLPEDANTVHTVGYL